MKMVMGKVSLWILLLLYFLTLIAISLVGSSTFDLCRYNVNSKPVYFIDEVEDAVYFSGSMIELHCHVSCEEECLHRSKLYQNGVVGNKLWPEPDENATYSTIKINNATVNYSGFYQCLRTVWPFRNKGRIKEIAGRQVEIVGRKFQILITDLRPAKHIVESGITHGDSIFLPCVVNTSDGVFPMPDRVEWRKDDRGLENWKNSYVTQDYSLLLTNLTTNISCHCVVYWKDSDYNGSRYQLVIAGKPAAKNVSVYPEGIKAKVGERVQFVCVVSGFGWNYTVKWYSISKPDDVLTTINHTHVLDIPNIQLNDSGSYYCKVKNEHGSFASHSSILQVIDPPCIVSLTREILINISTANNVILNCSFTGDLTHTMIYWIKGMWNLTDYVSIINNTAILNLTIDANNETFLGSYQCIVKNEAGYVSRTTRVLPKGFTSAPRNITTSIEYYSIDNCSVIVSWDPPVFNGSLAIYCYKIEVSHSGGRDLLLADCLKDSSYSWNECQNISEYYDIEFEITVVDEHKNERSKKAESKKLDKPEIMLNLMVDCTDNEVQVNRSLTTYPYNVDKYCLSYSYGSMSKEICFMDRATNLTTYPYNVDKYCLSYSCGSMSKEMCFMDRATNYASISGVPVHNNTCRYMVTAKRGKSEDLEPNSNIVSCRSPIITVSEQEFNGKAGDIITCTATGYPEPNIVWLNDNGSVVNKSRPVNDSAASVILTVRRSDAGNYRCFANNFVGNDTTIINIKTVQSIPILIIPENNKFTENSNITCTATGFPVPDIVWQNNDGSVVDKSRIKTGSVMATGVGNLFKMSVSMIIGRNDAGVYTCTANNSIGNDYRTINITVTSIPVITVAENEDTSTLTEGDNIACIATGYPAPDIVWLNDDGSVVKEDRLIPSSPIPTGDGSTFNVSVAMIVGRGDAGIYRCNASNSVGNTSYTFNVIVNSAPILTITESEQFDVVMEQTYRVNEDGNITCTAMGYPVPDVVWLNNDGSAVDKNRLITNAPVPTGTGDLFNVSVILMIKSTDNGSYWCFANNSLDTKVINITVTSNPVRINNISYVYLWLSSSLLIVVILFAIVLFIIKRRTRRIGYEPPPEILDTKVADFDETITDTPSCIEVFIGDDKSHCSSIREFDLENSKMLEEIMYKGDPVFTTISLTSIAESTSDIMVNDIINRESSSHYYDSSSSSNSNSNSGNSVQAQQHYDSGNPIVDNDPVTNEGSAYNI